MKLVNLERLKTIIANNSSEHASGYVCVGRGDSCNCIKDSFEIPYGDLYRRETVDSVVSYKKGNNGNISSCLYFVTEQFYNEHIKGAKVMTDNQRFVKLANEFYDHHGIVKHCKVKVVNKIKSGYGGWGGHWNLFMDSLINRTFTVINLDKSNGLICINDEDNQSTWWLPYMAVEFHTPSIDIPNSIPISDDYSVVFKEDGSIQVGCQKIPYDLLLKIQQAAKTVIDQIKQ